MIIKLTVIIAENDDNNNINDNTDNVINDDR